MPKYLSNLHEMVSTSPTEFWNDSCSIPDLTYAIEHGATGATTNPVIVGQVLKNELDSYKEIIRDFIKKMPTATEDAIAWKLNEYMACEGAKLLKPVFDKTQGKTGYISIQTNTKYYNNVDSIVEQACHFNTLAENIMVKMPVTKAGVKAIEECTYKGVTVNATVSFTVPQALAVGEAIERGLKRREQEGLDISTMYPVCTIMVGRIDDWLKNVAANEDIVVDPQSLELAGVAIFKRAYKIYKERGYKTRLLSAAYRNHFQWSEFIGGDVSMTITPKWIKQFNHCNIEVKNRMENEVDPHVIKQLETHFDDFIKAYEPDGMKVEEFDSFGATRATLMQFLNGYDDMVGIIRGFMVNG